jgi:hypothetical protein
VPGPKQSARRGRSRLASRLSARRSRSAWRRADRSTRSASDTGPGEECGKGVRVVEEAVEVGAEDLPVSDSTPSARPRRGARTGAPGPGRGSRPCGSRSPKPGRYRAGTGCRSRSGAASRLRVRSRCRAGPGRPRCRVCLPAPAGRGAGGRASGSRRRWRPACRRSAGGGDGTLPALLAQPGQVGLHGLGAGQHDQVGRRHALAGADPAEVHLRMQAQGVEVGVIGDARIYRRDDAQAGRPRPLSARASARASSASRKRPCR